ncbi:uncharacterized protein LOC107306586 isoform X2 [Coturnix japonica]|uniref:uncharacterized protein LOC107306586 isoform X2 n=1 Tax=Coturnix japonica TaxID=93934 RepID=UPI000777BC83|nr:uncharacterized protein LOC107306586 isoform X2 [Coturnix japonica]
MEEKPPKHPKVAWEESGAPQERKSPPEPYEVTEVTPLRADADWLPLYELDEVAVNVIETYGISKEKDLVQKMQYLNCICSLCSAAEQKGLTVYLDIFCFLNNVTENIEVLLCEEPRDQLNTALRYHCMNAIAAMSQVEAISEEELLHLLKACCRVIFCLPPTRELNICLYNHTLDAMDNMLEAMLYHCPTASFNSLLQRIFEVCLL